MDGRNETGGRGERIAAEYLMLAGYRIIETNLRTGRLEVDIVASMGDCLVFVEVKTRRSDGFGDALSAVTPAKVSRIARAAGRYLAGGSSGRYFREVRIDVIGIDISTGRGRMSLRHLRGVT